MNTELVKQNAATATHKYLWLSFLAAIASDAKVNA
jgi:hypothetical protein